MHTKNQDATKDTTKMNYFLPNKQKKKILWVSVKFAVIMRQRFNPSQDKSLICNK